MNSGRDELLSLIQSMSKSEKRYFKLEAKRSGEKRSSNYLKLFDAMNDMEEYDEDNLRKRFRKEKFIDHLPSEKRYLYQSILKSLRHYRSEKSAYAQIKEMILDAGYLQERGLYDQSLKMLKRARKQASHYEDTLSLLEINIKERNILRQRKDKKYEDQLRELIEEKNLLFQNTKLELELLEIMEELGLKLTRQFQLEESDESMQVINQRIEELETCISESPSANTIHSYYRVKSFYFQLLGQIDKTFEFYNKTVEWWDQYPHIKDEKFYRYRIAISNLISFFFSKRNLENYDYVLPLIEKLEKEEPKNFHEQGTIFEKVAIFKLLYYINIGDIQAAEALVNFIQDGLDTYKINPSPRLTIIGNVAIFYFSLEKFDHCKSWLEKIINGPAKRYRYDIQFLSRVLNIICHHELGSDADQMDSLCRALYRFSSLSKSKQKKKEKNLELELISQLKKLMNTPAYEKAEALTVLKQFLEQQKNPGTKRPPGSLELLLWVNSRLKSKPIIELIKNNPSD